MVFVKRSYLGVRDRICQMFVILPVPPCLVTHLIRVAGLVTIAWWLVLPRGLLAPGPGAGLQ